MTTTTLLPAHAGSGTLAHALDAAGAVSARFTPAWFTPVMGTSIIAVALVTLPGAGAVAHSVAAGVWALGAGLLIAAGAAWATQAVRHPRLAASHHGDPVRAHSYGAPAMSLMSVGVGAYLTGGALLPETVALALFVSLWTLGTVMGLASAILVPYLMFTRHTFEPDAAFGGWLMPVVAPMVSACTGALLIEHVREGQARLDFTLALLAMFGASLFASIILTTQVWSRLVHRSLPAAALIPTAWIVLGFLGQSTTAASLLADHSASVIGPEAAAAAPKVAVLYGVPTMGFAMLWLAILVLLTRHALRRGLPFTMSWWSFTFPVATCVTGASALAAHTGSAAVGALALGLFTALVSGWAITAWRTLGVAHAHVTQAWATSSVPR